MWNNESRGSLDVMPGRRGRSSALHLFIVVSLVGCSPVSVRNCAVVSSMDGGISLRSEVSNQSRMIVDRVSVEVQTESSDQKNSTQNEYEVNGPFQPGEWTRTVTHKSSHEVDALVIPRYIQLLPVKYCYPQAVLYHDGSLQILYNPM